MFEAAVDPRLNLLSERARVHGLGAIEERGLRRHDRPKRHYHHHLPGRLGFSFGRGACTRGSA